MIFISFQYSWSLKTTIRRFGDREGASDTGAFEVDIRSFRVLVYTKLGLLERFTHDFCLFSVLLDAKNGSRRISGPGRGER